MQTEKRRQRDRGRSGRTELQGTQQRAMRNTEEEVARLKEIFTTLKKQRKTTAGEKGDNVDGGVKGEPGGRDRSQGDGERGREKEKEVSSRRAVSEEGQRRRVYEVEREKLELISSHNEEVCRMQAELTQLRSSIEQGEAQRMELQYQLTVSQREADRASQLSKDKHTLTERAAELQLKVQELQKSLEITRQAREEDQHALQQEVEERDKLIQSFSSENQRLHRVLQDQEEALEESERRVVQMIKENEKEAEVNRRQGDELKHLKEREERSRREKEVSDQRVRTLESNMEAERAAHLESKFNQELVQLRVRDLDAALMAARSGHQEVQLDLELLRAQFREVERAYNVERERSGSTERTLESLQCEYEKHKSALNQAMEAERKVISDLTESLQEEQRQHANTKTQLEQMSQRQSDTQETFVNFMKRIKETLQQHNSTDSSPPVRDDGNLSPSEEVVQLLKTTLSSCGHKVETAEKQVQDLLSASERLQEENKTLQQLNSDQNRHAEESQQKLIKLGEEVTRLHQESSDWSERSRSLQAELEGEREKREREKEGRMKEVRKIMDHYQEESKVRLSFLYRLYQCLLAGCVLLDQPQSILGNFTWVELCDVIIEQVGQVTSDLREANEKIAHLQNVCKKKSMCVRKLQRSQEGVLSRLEECVRRREEAWSRQHTHTITQLQNELQVSRSQCDSLQNYASSLELRLSSLTSDLSSSLSACALLAGALKHTHRHLLALRTQKNFLSRRLQEREELEEEVRRLVGALGGEEEEEERRRKKKKRAVRLWRKSVWAVLAVRRWCVLANQTTVMLRVEREGGAAVCVCGETTTATQKGQDEANADRVEDDNSEPGAVCARWLHSKRLSSIIVSSMTDLQGALTHTGSSRCDIMSAAHSSMSCLLDHILDQSDLASSLSPGRIDDDKVLKALVSSLQQHFLLFSQRLHTTEVEKRSLRLEVTNLKRGLKRERTVPAEQFHSVCEELRQALSREQEAQTLLQEQTHTLHTLQQRVNTHTSGPSDTEQRERESAQSLTEARQEVKRKERSLRILGKHLLGVQREKKQLEEKLQQLEEVMKDANSCKECSTKKTKAAEVAEIPKTSPFTDLKASEPPLTSDLLREPPVSLRPAPLQTNPAPSSPQSKASRAKKKDRKAVKKDNTGRRSFI